MMGLLGVSLVMTLVIWIGGWLVRRHYSQMLDLPESAAAWRLGSRIGAVVILAMLVGWGALFAVLTGGNEQIGSMLMGLYVVGALAVLSAIVIIIEAVLRIVRGPGGLLVKAGELVLGVSALYAIWAIFDYGLANFSLVF